MEPILSELESFFSALSDKTRLSIVLFLLEKEEVTVDEISRTLNKSQSLISHHLACLRNCGIVKVRREGKFSYYSLADEDIKNLVKNAIEHVRKYSKSILACEVVSNSKPENLSDRKIVLQTDQIETGTPGNT
ncbi:ArsR/SmtB family transcription factor [Sulfolobus acidocaldarius]|uniref:Conserved protein n=4 Tax=Sulfolobus acidocaldarius TaxID=2285 RepID=Q4J865_SULAC|nr:metalloregulator ArsR/SmtB family transcription factor [Sulfolobus acidocaldarius]AAY81016.1 conserved protein [Sulfolobus acidocaldarius DSM 639]AGE71621.1 hypothetical protein SacN8_08305 [Sulfolobus acidocaldarius N8]AGE73895.1 hypothetical protein SacRon12I_08320 [Sulfolobus acidocaldarius Ron12/I]ALU30161.1 ArsR family transcriptional regulator [Sulfolobus acidocaldarius]ALU30856.1 ArsR family transcriptional regulator [Sulfolobus acidocaldarius]